MDDKELIAYAETHCQTPRALFSEEHANRLLRLAGFKYRVSGWVAIHEDDMKEILAKVRRNSLKLVKG